jgi:hypothetical protein
MDPAPRRFPIRVEPRYRWILRVFGVKPGNAHVDLGEAFEAHFGWAHVTTPVSNITRWSIEGPWRAITALGVRKTIGRGDLTFAGTPAGGVRVDFRQRVPFWRFRLTALYVTVEDLEGFGRALAAWGIPGEDRRNAATVDQARA